MNWICSPYGEKYFGSQILIEHSMLPLAEGSMLAGFPEDSLSLGVTDYYCPMSNFSVYV